MTATGLQPFQKTNRSAFLNFARSKYEAYTGQVDVRSYPYYLCIDPCDICQLRCPTCPTGIENESKRGSQDQPFIYRRDRSMLTPELFDAVLDELGEFLFRIMFYNYGEPLMNKNLPDFVRKAKGLDIETEIHSNLSLHLSDQEIEDLLSSGLDYLIASVDGFSQETYEMHRVGGNLDLVKTNLERLAKVRDRLGLKTLIAYKLLVFSFNEHEVPATEQYCRDLGINFICGDAFIHERSWLPSHRKDEQPLYSQADMKSLVTQWESVGSRDYFTDQELRPHWLPTNPETESKSPSFCAWHYGYSVVTAGGPVAPCCAVAKEKDDFGTVIPGQVSFSDVWNNDRYRKSRAAFANRDVPELDIVDTVCTRCYFPKFVQHLFTSHDPKVMAQFQRALKNSDPTLETALQLQFLADQGNEQDRDSFVEFFEKNLAEEFAPT